VEAIPGPGTPTWRAVRAHLAHPGAPSRVSAEGEALARAGEDLGPVLA
jgi:hypothetical protein